MRIVSVSIPAVVASLLISVSSQNLLAQNNLVSNPGFEDNGGSFSSWTFTPAGVGSFADVNVGGLIPHSDNNYFGFASAAGAPDTLSQVIAAATTGANYDINFWVNTAFQPGGFLNVSFAGQTLLNLVGQPLVAGTDANGWANFDFQVTVPVDYASTPDITFAGGSANAVVGIDDVSVTQVPEVSSTFGLLGLAILGMGALFKGSFFRGVRTVAK